VPVDGPAPQPPSGKLHHESGVGGKGGVLPARDAARRGAAKPAERQPHEARVATLDAGVAARSDDQPGVLVIPDADGGPELLDEAHDRARLRFRARPRAGVIRAARSIQRPPSPGRVPVEIDAPGVLSSTGGAPVRIELVHDQQHGVPRGLRPAQATCDRLAGGLVAVHASDHEHATRAVQLPDLPGADRPAFHRAPDHRPMHGWMGVAPGRDHRQHHGSQHDRRAHAAPAGAHTCRHARKGAR
jgi:hypothetical protein